MRVLLSRTDNIGDVVLTLPVAGLLKKHFPEAKVTFLGRTYTQAVLERCLDIDHFLDCEQVTSSQLGGFDYFIHVFPNREIARKAKMASNKMTIGTSHRWYHWYTCDRLVNLGRKKSKLHEAQLNIQLLTPLGIKAPVPLDHLHELVHWERSDGSRHSVASDKFNLIIHPKSGGSAAEWPVSAYHKLCCKLSADDFHVYITGTREEGDKILSECPELLSCPHVIDMTGKFSLQELIGFIEQCDGMLAGSTGPLHIASIARLRTLGLYPSKRPMHPGRWQPIGPRSQVLSPAQITDDILIEVDEVLSMIQKWIE